LPDAGINLDPVLWKDLPFPNYGDPRSKSTNTSNGPGTGGGVGTGKGTGIGEGTGPAWGPAMMETPAVETILVVAAAVAERTGTIRVRTSTEYFDKPKSPRVRE
jgi:hypothetical protein